MTYECVLSALADPTRRRLLERMAGGPCSVGELADCVPVSRPAVSQHLRVLSDAGLLEMERDGTRRLYRLAAGGADALRRYLDRLWTEALEAYADEAGTQARGPKSAAPPAPSSRGKVEP